MEKQKGMTQQWISNLLYTIREKLQDYQILIEKEEDEGMMKITEDNLEEILMKVFEEYSQQYTYVSTMFSFFATFFTAPGTSSTTPEPTTTSRSTPQRRPAEGKKAKQNSETGTNNHHIRIKVHLPSIERFFIQNNPSKVQQITESGEEMNEQGKVEDKELLYSLLSPKQNPMFKNCSLPELIKECQLAFVELLTTLHGEYKELIEEHQKAQHSWAVLQQQHLEQAHSLEIVIEDKRALEHTIEELKKKYNSEVYFLLFY